MSENSDYSYTRRAAEAQSMSDEYVNPAVKEYEKKQQQQRQQLLAAQEVLTAAQAQLAAARLAGGGTAAEEQQLLSAEQQLAAAQELLREGSQFSTSDSGAGAGTTDEVKKKALGAARVNRNVAGGRASMGDIWNTNGVGKLASSDGASAAAASRRTV